MEESLNDFNITNDYDRAITFYAPLREDLRLKTGTGLITQIPEISDNFKIYNGNRGLSLVKEQYLRFESYTNLPQSGEMSLEFCTTDEQQCRSKSILFNYGTSPNTIKIFIENNKLKQQIGHFTDLLLDEDIITNKWYKIGIPGKGIKWKGIDTRRNPYFFLNNLKYPFTGYIRNLKIKRYK